MRTSQGRYAGGGMLWAFREDEEIWQDNVVSVKLPSDGLDEEELESLSGPCITIKEGVRK